MCAKYILTKCYHALSADQLFMHKLHVEGFHRSIQINSFVVPVAVDNNIAVHFTRSFSIKLNLLCLFSPLLNTPFEICFYVVISSVLFYDMTCFFNSSWGDDFMCVGGCLLIS